MTANGTWTVKARVTPTMTTELPSVAINGLTRTIVTTNQLAHPAIRPMIVEVTKQMVGGWV